MRIHRRIRNLTEPERAQFEEYLEKKIDLHVKPMLEVHYPDPDTVHLFAEIEKFDKHSAFSVGFVLEMPRKRLVSKEVKHTITEAMDFATSRVEKGIVKHFKKLTRA